MKHPKKIIKLSNEILEFLSNKKLGTTEIVHVVMLLLASVGLIQCIEDSILEEDATLESLDITEIKELYFIQPTLGPSLLLTAASILDTVIVEKERREKGKQ